MPDRQQNEDIREFLDIYRGNNLYRKVEDLAIDSCSRPYDPASPRRRTGRDTPVPSGPLTSNPVIHYINRDFSANLERLFGRHTNLQWRNLQDMIGYCERTLAREGSQTIDRPLTREEFIKTAKLMVWCVPDCVIEVLVGFPRTGEMSEQQDCWFQEAVADEMQYIPATPEQIRQARD